MGAWVGYAVASGIKIGNFLSKTMIVVSLCGFLAGIIFGFHRLPSVITWGVPSALLVAGLVFSESNGYLPQLIKKCAPLGDSSYSLYLLHVLLLDAATLAVMTSSSAIVEHIRQAGTIEMIAICSVMSVYCIVRCARFVSPDRAQARQWLATPVACEDKVARPSGKKRREIVTGCL